MLTFVTTKHEDYRKNNVTMTVIEKDTELDIIVYKFPKEP